MKIINYMKYLREEKGGYIIEASVTLPLVILAIVTISSLISIEQVRENVYFAASEELRYSMIASYVYKDEVMLPIRLEKRLNEENKGKDVELNVRGFFTGSTQEDTNDLIKFYVTHKTNISLPMSFGRVHKSFYKFAGRKFTGDNMGKVKLGYNTLETTGGRNLAYVFPQSGEKYHKEECSYILPKTDLAVATSALMFKYKPCSLCDAKKIHFGMEVFIFPDSGKFYHTKSCPTVKKKL